VTTLAAMDQKMTIWDRDKIHGTRLSRGRLRSWIDRLLNSTPVERAQWAAIAPARADYLLAGACVLEALCNSATRDFLIVSDGGVRHGLLHET